MRSISRLVEDEARGGVYINGEIGCVSVLEKATPEKIEREVEAGQEEKSDLRGTIKVIARNTRSPTGTRERVSRRRDVGVEMEAEESDEAKSEG